MTLPRDEVLIIPATESDQLYRASHYGRALRNLLPAGAFKPQPRRLWFGAMHMSIIVAMGWLCVGTHLPLAIKLGAACLAGQSWAGLQFFAHELWHGSVLKTGRLEHAIGSVCAAIHLQSGTGWKLWHNQTHHKNTQVGRMDPDALPYLEAVRTQPLVRAAQRMAPGYGGPLSYVELFYAFTMKNAIATLDQIFGRAHGNGRGKKTRIISETLLSTLPWIYLCARFGWPGFWLLFVLPLACANTVLMLYIYTNHHLSPRVPINDPLINSLTVTSPRFIQWFHGDFGFHVGHHLFPSMSVRFAPQLHELLRAHYPDRYQSMPFWKAIRTLYTTGTCYTEDGERLVDLRTGEARWTLRTGRTDFAVAGDVDVTPQHAGAVARRAARHGAVEFASEERGAMPSDTGT